MTTHNDLAAAVRELGALPMPAGVEPQPRRIDAVDVPLAQVSAMAILLQAEQRTHSPSDLLAYRLDEWLVTHPDAAKAEPVPGWDHHIAQLVKLNELHRQAAVFNAAHPVGTPVTAYPGARPEDDPKCERIHTRVRSKATVTAGAAVVMVDGYERIALSHIDIRPGGAS
ncbi:hypothetical protein AB0M68_03875 [Streptomyces sp. NPDC051453]|uniref:hypothetical protein n=1 Tax=Streptomyces sp. NPDC051453 TaxID=3154941 RepID=UPI0034455B13